MDVMVKIAERAEEMDILMSNRFNLIMDLSVADEKFNLRLTELVGASNFNFSHDIVGIQNNINRETGEINSEFIPRYAGF